jgi:hypothetical protein
MSTNSPRRFRIRAREIEEFVYCKHTWELRLQGIKPVGEKLEDGAAYHAEVEPTLIPPVTTEHLPPPVMLPQSPTPRLRPHPDRQDIPPPPAVPPPPFSNLRYLRAFIILGAVLLLICLIALGLYGRH